SALGVIPGARVLRRVVLRARILPRAGAPPGARVLTVGGADGGRAVARRPRGGGVLAQRGSCGHAEARAAAAGGPAILHGACRGRLTVARAGGGGGRRRRRTRLGARGCAGIGAGAAPDSARMRCACAACLCSTSSSYCIGMVAVIEVKSL